VNLASLLTAIHCKESFLCIGLDTDYDKIPSFLRKEKDPIWAFNKLIIEATEALSIAYKFNLAFYEVRGASGWKTLEKTLELIPAHILTIADGKRGDIQNTSQLYAKTFFETFQFDAVTVNPYMGKDAILPFLAYPQKWVFILALTSNQGAEDFQHCLVGDNTPLYQYVIQTAQYWPSSGVIGFVVGATYPEALERLRARLPDTFFLVPGIGAQGGELSRVCKLGPRVIMNISRSILYAGQDKRFAEAAHKAALDAVMQMRQYYNFQAASPPRQNVQQ
jgi:orotidine-5'-phosphate decarboxylase